MQLIPKDQYPDYYRLLAEPMAFDIVQSRLRSKMYTTVTQFTREVNLIFSNAKYYNEDRSRIWLDALALERYFALIMQEAPPVDIATPPVRPGMKIRIGSGSTPAASPTPEQKITLKFGQPSSTFAPSPLSIPADSALNPSPSEQKPDMLALSETAQMDRMPTPADRAQLLSRVNPYSSTASAVAQYLASPSNQAPINPASMTITRQPSHEYIPPPPVIKRSNHPVAAFSSAEPCKLTVDALALTDFELVIPFFQVRCFPNNGNYRPVFANSPFRQHSFVVPPGTTTLEIVACSSDLPLADRAPPPATEEPQPETEPTAEEVAATTRSGRVSKPKKALSPPKNEDGHKSRLNFRCTSRPSNLEMAMLAASPQTDGPLALAKFSIRPLDKGCSVFEVSVKATAQGPEQIYRLCITHS
jgi:hypothetical protein